MVGITGQECYAVSVNQDSVLQLFHTRNNASSVLILGNGVALFLFLAFIPATIFFLLVMTFSIDISLGPMNAILCIVQMSISFVNCTIFIPIK